MFNFNRFSNSLILDIPVITLSHIHRLLLKNSWNLCEQNTRRLIGEILLLCYLCCEQSGSKYQFLNINEMIDTGWWKTSLKYLLCVSLLETNSSSYYTQLIGSLTLKGKNDNCSSQCFILYKLSTRPNQFLQWNTLFE